MSDDRDEADYLDADEIEALKETFGDCGMVRVKAFGLLTRAEFLTR